jgi:hypothetical protein
MIFIIITFTRRILNCISANRRENHAPASPVSRPPLTEDPILVAPPESQRSFWLWFLQADIIKNLYSSITHMLLSMHVHFLIITYIHISCIFSELVSQCASVCMTQLFYILIYSIHVKVYCYCLTLNCYCLHIELLLSTHSTVNVQPLLSNFELLLSTHWTVTVQLLLSNFELLLSNRYCITLNCYCLHIELLLSKCYYLTLNCYCLDIWTVTVWTLIRFLTISKVLKLHF